MKTYKIYCKSTGIQYGKIYAEDWCDLMTQLSKSGGNIEDIKKIEDACEEVVALAKEAKKAKPLYITIARKKNRDIHYAV